MPQELISVAICTYNRADCLRVSLETVTRQITGGIAYEIIVVDDDSTDATRQVVEEIAGKTPTPVRYVYLEGRRGLAYTRNRGVAEAKGDWIAFFDDDQIADPDWLKNLLAVAETHGAHCVGGSRRLDLPPGELAALGPTCRGLLGENVYSEPPSILEGKELPTTGNLLLSREIFHKVGGFDPRFTGGEDTDFLNRTRCAGFPIWTAPRAMCAHMIPPYRTRARYLRWASRRWGNSFAKIDRKQHGRLGMLALLLARFVQMLLINAPTCVVARIRGRKAEALDRHMLLWRTDGYVRTALWLVAPGLFPQRRFIEEMDFGREREMFGGE